MPPLFETSVNPNKYSSITGEYVRDNGDAFILVSELLKSDGSPNYISTIDSGYLTSEAVSTKNESPAHIITSDPSAMLVPYDRGKYINYLFSVFLHTKEFVYSYPLDPNDDTNNNNIGSVRIATYHLFSELFRRYINVKDVPAIYHSFLSPLIDFFDDTSSHFTPNITPPDDTSDNDNLHSESSSVYYQAWNLLNFTMLIIYTIVDSSYNFYT